MPDTGTAGAPHPPTSICDICGEIHEIATACPNQDRRGHETIQSVVARDYHGLRGLR